MNKTYITDSAGETQKIAENFVKSLKAEGIIIALCGNLGSGKTTFVQGLVKGFGIKKRIISPTFIIVRTYKLKASHFTKATRVKKALRDKQNLKSFYHIDLYRIEGGKDLKGLGIEEVINDPENVIVIEWAEKAQSLLPKKRWDVKFEDLGGNRRKIIVNQKL